MSRQRRHARHAATAARAFFALLPAAAVLAHLIEADLWRWELHLLLSPGLDWLPTT